uniref:Uncharacterized protein n=1 Tax=Anopheles quadriannulatus TaxID=34691 RepID=A0A182XU34_ANOQN
MYHVVEASRIRMCVYWCACGHFDRLCLQREAATCYALPVKVVILSVLIN